jgi:hypothetical protein
VKNETGTLVFAYWRGFYYPGRVTGANGQKYAILFDDNDSSTLDISKLRMQQLRIGDRVRLAKSANKKAPSTVKSVDEATSDILIVDGKNESWVTISELVIKAAWIDATWDDRCLSPGDIVISTEWDPAERRPSLKGSSNIARGQKPTLQQTAFIISLSSGDNATKIKQKEKLIAEMHAGSVNIFQDWSELYTLDGSFLSGGKHWRGELGDVRYRGENIQRVALLGETETAKPRYLFALACGIPCLRIEFWKDAQENVCPIHLAS